MYGECIPLSGAILVLEAYIVSCERVSLIVHIFEFVDLKEFKILPSRTFSSLPLFPLQTENTSRSDDIAADYIEQIWVFRFVLNAVNW